MKQVFKNRLLKLAEYLSAKVKEENFDMMHICNMDAENVKTHFAWNPSKDKFTPFDCGAQACAIGFCPMAFPRLKLKYNFDYGTVQKNGRDWDGEKYFGLRTKQWNYLFGTEDIDGDDRDTETPKEVAKRIRKFVREDGFIPEQFSSY